MNQSEISARDIEHLSYPDFAHQKPVLYGHITVNGKLKTGSFRPEWNKWDNSLCYSYYTPQGNRGKGGFTMRRAWNLLKSGGLSLNEKYGDPAA